MKKCFILFQNVTNYFSIYTIIICNILKCEYVYIYIILKCKYICIYSLYGYGFFYGKLKHLYFPYFHHEDMKKYVMRVFSCGIYMFSVRLFRCPTI